MHALHEWLAVGSLFGDWFSEEWFAASVSNSWVRLAIDSAAKATVLLLLALLATTLWRNSSAALRHRVWCLTFAGLVILPGLSAALPAWRLPILPAPVSEPAPTAAPAVRAPQQPSAAPIVERFTEARPVEQPRPTAFDRRPRPETATASLPALEPAPEVASMPLSPPARTVIDLSTVWLFGFGIALLPLVVGVVRNALVHMRARPFSDAGWAGLLDELRARLTLRRRVKLLETDASVMPMTWGLVCPVVLLPRQARQWAERLRRFVLLHELAHVKRGDVGFQMLARVACALYWFHPLAWLALRRLRIERELACDDCVLAAGERPSDYAAELLRVAHDYRPPRLAAAVAMAQRGSLEHRIRALLDRARSHLPMSARSARLLLVLAAAIVTAVAMVRPGPRAVGDEQNGNDGEADTNAARTVEAESRATVPVEGRVVDEEDRPIAGARVRLIQSWDSGDSSMAPIVEWSGDTRTDGGGRFSLDAAPFADPPSAAAKRLAATHDFRAERCAVATADGYGFVFEHLPTSDDGAASERNVVLKLPRDSAPIEGRVLDLEGRPVRAARVTLRQLILLEKEKLDDWLSGLPEGIAQNGPYEIPWGCALMSFDNFWNPFPAQLTDDDGRFTFTGVGADRVAHLQIEAPALASTWTVVVTRPMKAVRLPSGRRQFRAQMCFGSTFDIAVEPSRPIRGSIVDAESGTPIAGAEVRLNLSGQEGFLNTVSDAAGRYELRDAGRPAPGEKDELSVFPANGQPYFRTNIEVPQATGPDPVVCDVRLRRAVSLRGRVTDRRTKQPVQGAVRYYPWLSNAAAKDFPNFEPGVHKLGYDDRYATDEDGNFMLPALPGRGLLTVVAEHGERYPLGEGSDDIADLWQPDGHDTNVYHISRGELGLDQDNAVRSVEIPVDAREFTIGVQLAPLPVIRLDLFDDGGQPLTGVETQGLRPSNPFPQHHGSRWDDPAPTAAVELIGPAAGEWRDVLFRHRDRRLGTIVRFTPDDVGNAPRKIRLQPFATIAGRLVDADGKPVAGAYVDLRAKPGDDGKQPGIHPRQFQLPLSNGTTTDAHGRFQLTSLPPGTRWEVHGFVNHGDLKWNKMTPLLNAGENIDLGDISPEPLKATRGAGDDKNAAKPPATTDDTAKQAASPNDNAVTLRGRAIGPDDKPVAAVKFYLRYANRNNLPALPLGESGADGRFELRVDKTSLDTSAMPDPWPTARLLATASGLGFQTIDALSEKSGELTVRLPRDVPINGRIITLEGRPVVGARLSVSHIARCRGDRLDDYIEAYRSGPVLFEFETYEQILPGMPEHVITDSQGKFTLRGFGAERVVKLDLEGPEIEFTRFDLMTRESATISQPRSEGKGGSADRVYGATFEYAAAPARKIVGTVRDRETGRPLSGVTVRSRTSHSPQTDQAGRFELLGHAKTDAYFLRITPKETGYFSAAIEIKDTPGLTPLTADVELVRGMLAEGRVSVAGSNEPYRALVEYYPLYPNPYVERLGERVAQPCAATTCDADGHYRLPVLPGPGVLAVRADGGEYYDRFTRALVTRDDLAKLFGDTAQHGDDLTLFVAFGKPSVTLLSQSNYNRLILIKPDDDAVSLRQDAQLEVGRTVDGTLVGPDGEPLTGVTARGLTGQHFQVDELTTASFTVKALHPRLDRELIFEHRESQLAAAKTIHGDEPGPLTIRLAPCGAVVGRILDAEGQPLAGTQLSLGRPRLFPPEFTPTTDSSGRFRVERLVPGLKYALRVENGAKLITTLDVVVAAGETKDLGGVAPSPPDAVPDTKANAAPAAEKDKVPAADKKGASEPVKTVLRGRVLGPNGEPVVGAGLYWPQLKPSQPPAAGSVQYVKRAETDAEGRFELSLTAGDVPASAQMMRLIAQLPRLGLDWIDFEPAKAPKEITLRLVEDHPIRGRVIDTEGRPLADVPVVVTAVHASASGSLDDFLTLWQRDQRTPVRRAGQFSSPKLDRRLQLPPQSLLGAVTDRQGRFELTGVGSERVATLSIAPPGSVSADVTVVNRAGFDAAKYNADASAAAGQMRRPGTTWRLSGPEFDHVAEAELVVRGQVFTEPDHAPVAGAMVGASGGGGLPISQRTDAAGRYELHGIPRSQKSWLNVRPTPGGELLSRTIEITAAPGETAAEIDVELKRGVVVEGRVIDRATSRGVRSGVKYVPVPGNVFVDQPGFDDFKRSRGAESTDAEGRFRLIVPPGTGVLIAQARGNGPRIDGHEINRYRQANFTAEERERVPITENGDDRHFTAADNSLEFLNSANAVKVIDAPPDGGPVVCDLSVDSGKTLEISIEDDQGQPLADAWIAGVTDSRSVTFKTEEAKATIYGLGADRPRRICLLHPGRRLAVSLTLTGDEPGPVVGRLAPTATIVGRARDEDGSPLAGAIVQMNYERRSASEIDRFARAEGPVVKTDDNGHFRVENVLPGERFLLGFQQEGHYFVAKLTVEQRELKAGQEVDVVETSVKEIR